MNCVRENKNQHHKPQCHGKTFISHWIISFRDWKDERFILCFNVAHFFLCMCAKIVNLMNNEQERRHCWKFIQVYWNAFIRIHSFIHPFFSKIHSNASQNFELIWKFWINEEKGETAEKQGKMFYANRMITIFISSFCWKKESKSFELMCFKS